MTLLEYLVTDFIIQQEGKMSPEQFCIWLDGVMEVTPSAPTPSQWAAICLKLDSVNYNTHHEPIIAPAPVYPLPSYVTCYD